MSDRLAELKAHLAALAAALPDLPDAFQSAWNSLLDELNGRGAIALLILIAGFLVLGAGTEWLFRSVTAPFLRNHGGHSSGSVSERLRGIGVRLAIDFAGVAIFTLGSVGAFLAFDWPPLLRRIVVAYLIGAVALRLVLVAGQFVLAPGFANGKNADQLRLVPINTEAARFWFGRLALFAAWLAFGWATVDVLYLLGFTRGERALVAYTLGLGLLAISLNVAWAWPTAGPSTVEQEGRPARISRTTTAILLSIGLVLLWALWVAGIMRLFWLGVVALLLPGAIKVSEQAVRHVLRPLGTIEPADTALAAVYLDRGVRALLIVGAALLLAYVWQVDLVEMTSRDTLATRLARGILSSVVILLIADLVWQVVKTLIDRRLARITELAPPGSPEALRQARLQTLLPIFRNAIFVLVCVVSAMMALSGLGIEIGPLIAGAGVAGIAVGFGAQTLVRDFISGVFYLLDDAFRVGEYIRSGNYRGTVESLGFRSIKLRHHRGPVFTVPYGQLGAVENLSRDWVIDKVSIRVAFDTDLDKVKKIIKAIGKELAQDPEFASDIIEPLKMQGVEQFSDFAIQIRLKMMTRPGQQFTIRRRAYAMIKKAFDENGIKFAFPTVQVRGREEEAAAAQQALDALQPASPA